MDSHEQLRELVRELEATRAHVHGLAEVADDELWSRRPDEGRWSIGECVAHLNLTTEAYMPTLREAIGKGRARVGRAPRRYRMDPVGWLLTKSMEPPARLRLKTGDAFVARIETARDRDVADFDREQNRLIERVRESEALPLGRIRIRSPFDSRIKYSLYSAYRMIAAHQRRHLWQADRALEELTG